MKKNQPDHLHPIKVVVRRTGLSADLLRAWEKRYAAVTPLRSDTGRRLYTDEDLDRLILLRRATEAGRPISRVSPLPTPELERIVEEDEAAIAKAAGRFRGSGPEGDPGFVEAAIQAILDYDERSLDSVFDDAARTPPWIADPGQDIDPVACSCR